MFRISSGNRICSSKADLSRQSVLLNCLITSAVVLRWHYCDSSIATFTSFKKGTTLGNNYYYFTPPLVLIKGRDGNYRESGQPSVIVTSDSKITTNLT